VARSMLGIVPMKNLSKIMVALGLVVSAGACKSDAEKRAERVDEARERVADKQEDVRDEQEDVREEVDDVNKATEELADARAEFVAAIDKQMQDIDNRLTQARAKAGFDATRAIQLRAEAAALRAKAVDNTRPFDVTTERSEFDRIMRDIDTELGRAQ
jgi:uncharacterized coiled-coil DUF342 family protein